MSGQMNFGRESFDKKMAAALLKLPVPDGLEERVLRRLSENETSAIAGDAACVSASNAISSHSRIHRRHWLGLASALAASVALVVGISIWPREEKSFTLVQLLDSAPGWLEALQTSDGWQSSEHLPQRLLPSRNLNSRIVQWRDAAQLVGRSAVAYTLASATGKRATLLVLAQADRVAASTPPPNPQGTTLGLMVGCWQQGDLVYVLLVEGRERDYREFLTLGSRPTVT